MNFEVNKESIDNVEKIYEFVFNFYKLSRAKQLVWLNTLKKEIDRVKKEN